MNIINTLKYEALHILRSSYKMIAILLFLVVSIYGLHNGYSLYKERSNEIVTIKEKSRNLPNDALEWYETGQKGPEERPWVDVNTPFWAMWYANHHIFDAPNPLMTYSIGQAEQFAYYKRVSMWSTAYDKDLTAEISNPERVAIGSLDFSFVWLFLMPLLLIVLTYSIHGLERDLGFTKLLSVQEPNLKSWIAKRFVTMGIFSTIILVLLVYLPALFGGYLGSHLGDITLLFLYKLLYLLFWLVLLTLISFYGKGQTDTALKMVGLWLVLTIVLPGLVHQYVSLKHPPGFMMEIINAQRDDREAIYDTELDNIKQAVFETYPALRESKLAHNDSLVNRPARNGMYRTALNLHMNEVVNRVMEDHENRNALVKSTYFINPIMAFQNRINTIAKTDFETNQNYRKRIQEAVTNINKHLIIDEWNAVNVDEPHFINYINLLSDE
jgi:ABC-2 type transport system permease protein